MCEPAACGLLGMWVEPSLVVGGNKSIWVVEHALYLQRRLCAMNIPMKIALKSNNKHRSYKRISFRDKQVCSQPKSMQHFF